jgi:Zn-dependent M28 family amino/carboxypeptidase
MQTFMVGRELADALLNPGGLSLARLQETIDSTQSPASFELTGTRLKLDLRMEESSMEVRNVFGWIEGSDPLLKEEFLIYMAHYDHVGTDEMGGVFNGADDNASGSVALLEIAEALVKEKKKPARSIGFLWVTAEEIGLYGSRYYTTDPLVPLERTSAAINLDMVGRSKRPEDALSDRRNLTIVGKDTVKVIGGLQSKLLMEINRQVLKDSDLAGNYDYNRPDDPNRYFYRSDHVNFARQDIPVLFYSTGTHADYHRTTDTEDRIDYEKFVRMTRFSFRVGYRIADYPGPIPVDNPMSGW